MNWSITGIAAVIGAIICSAAVAKEPKKPLVDGFGNQRYMIFLDEERAAKEPTGIELPARGPSDPANLVDKYGWHKASVRALVKRLERTYGVKAFTLTSHTVPMFSAHLSQEVFQKVASDPAVSEILPLHENDLVYSAWADQIAPGSTTEIIPWGKTAIGTNDSLSDWSDRHVYMIDGGIQQGFEHVDLNIDFTANNSGVNDGWIVYPLHANVVAGVLGARMNTGRVRGINPNMRIFTLNAGTVPDLAANAMDWVLWHAEVNGIYSVANFSLVSDDINDLTKRDKMAKYIRRASNRVLFVQAAGNFHQDACLYAYPSTNGYDGILVVGGIDENGRPVVPPGPGLNGYVNDGVQSQPGSNYGSCVEVWAPSQRVWSTDHDNPNRVAIRQLSGTSVAAPHVAALAARFGSTTTTPVQRERYIRGKLFWTGFAQVPSYTQPLSEPVPSRLWPIDAYADSTAPGSSPAFVSDGLYISNNVWNAGHGAPGWIELDLGSSRCITGVRLTPEQFPEGDVFHRIHVGDWYPLTVVGGISAKSANLEPLSRAIDACGRYVRIETTLSPSWVAWREIEIYGF